MEAGGIVSRVESGALLSELRPGTTVGSRSYRFENIDLLRGLVIVVMALDHVRDYTMNGAPLDPLSNPDVGAPLFFTRWITHFCAPVFVTLAGVSAGLMTARRSPGELATFLLKRGVWLVLLEWFVVSTGWSFAPAGMAQASGLVAIPMQVIWVIGASMIVLAGAQYLGHRACLVLGAAVVVGHNALDAVWPMTGGPFDTMHPLWVALHGQMGFAAPPFLLVFVYPVLPWIGVMLLGFGSASLWKDDAGRRDARLTIVGLGATVAFVGIRTTGLYGDPNPWQGHSTTIAAVIDFLNVTKYPPSLLYLLMTLGPAALFVAHADRLPRLVRDPLITFGRAPLAFYVVHLYVVHTIGVVLGVAQGFQPQQFLTFSFFFPSTYGIGLPGVYAIWVLVVLALYPLCRWVSAVKARRKDWWLSYV
jgi:uncharacterized membrane protein